MRVAGGLVTPDRRRSRGRAVGDAVAGAARCGARARARRRRATRSTAARTSRSAARRPRMAIYHNALRDLVTWHGVRAPSDDLPPAPDLRVVGGRRYFLHYKATTTIVFWQEGPILMAITVRAARRARDGHRACRVVGRTTLIQSARRTPWSATPSMSARQLRWGLLGTARINRALIPAIRASARSAACGRGQPIGRARAQLCRRVGDRGRLRQLRGDAGRPADRRGVHPAAKPPARGVDAPRDCRGQARAVREADGADRPPTSTASPRPPRVAASRWPKRSCTATIR